ncbi:MAG TPA: type IV toxin-antitoxin system AbiEi family antitoxin domain-containing protein [Solirubrobacterales bacterium]|jgi:very-short-patch-repair endonuclease|nr:type IV toxin-antitoxin system AbiEi family antitoxin domain-containing protein [Solirubrobacterales bacterium]
MREEVDPVEAVLARIAVRQHGVVSVAQLYEIGIDKSGVSRRVRLGRLQRLHRGIYGVGHRPVSRRGFWMAAALACGEGAVLSHRSAAELWELLRPRRGVIEVSTPRRGGRAERTGIRLHRCPSLVVGMVTQRHGIPVTTPARTISDLRGTVPQWLWRRAVRQAELAGYRLGPEVKSDRTRSDLERDFLRICRRTGLPAPEVNVKVGRWTVDFLWRDERLAVETDSYRYHRGRIAFQDDHARELDLRRLGFELRRFDERQISEQPERVAADLVDGLGRA